MSPFIEKSHIDIDNQTQPNQAKDGFYIVLRDRTFRQTAQKSSYQDNEHFVNSEKYTSESVSKTVFTKPDTKNGQRLNNSYIAQIGSK